MDRIKGLQEYTALPQYRRALGLPEEQTESYELYAQGEYNINYLFTHPVSGQKLLLRVNIASQMHLENQIEYEANALRLLEPSGRTPKVYYVDGSREHLDYGLLVMEFLPGRALDYRKELLGTAEILADIHSLPVCEGCGLISPKEPLSAILEECEAMVKTYMESPLGDDLTKLRIRRMLDKAWEKVKSLPAGAAEHRCIINTELNSTNFLMNDEGKSYLIDWEKPLLGEPAQDLGHFLAPTTTFWKTDVILTDEEIEAFLDAYIEKAGGRFPLSCIKERTRLFIPVTCMRGLTWCAMAWVQYQAPDKLIFNQSTFDKLQAYLSDSFLARIESLWG